jgi:uncharacterized protein
MKAKRKSKVKLSISIVLVLSSILFIMCEKDSVIDLSASYGTRYEKNFGEELALVQEVNFTLDKFTIVGDIRTPINGSNHPLMIMSHGSGSATRNGSVPFDPLIEIFLKNGYAVLSWDKPGSGESTGNFQEGYIITGRAKILADIISILKDNSSIDHSKIGLWGISQAGWVIPKASTMTHDISFVISVSGGGEAGIEQFAFQVGQAAACDGVSQDQVQIIEENWSQMARASSYDEYREAVDKLVQYPEVVNYTGISVVSEENWNAWPTNIDAFYDPMIDAVNMTIPILAIYGELDRYVDPIQGAQAYADVCLQSGNNDCLIEIISGAGHVLAPAETGCFDEFVSNTYVTEYLELIDNWICTQ